MGIYFLPGPIIPAGDFLSNPRAKTALGVATTPLGGYDSLNQTSCLRPASPAPRPEAEASRQ
jgi:hypothetical protein